MTDPAKPLTADEIADRLRQYADPTNDHGVYPLLIEKHEAAVIVATIEQQAEQIMKLRAVLMLAQREREWLDDTLENETCSDLCDKTYETQGCIGHCARDDGLKSFRTTTVEIDKVLIATEPVNDKR